MKTNLRIVCFLAICGLTLLRLCGDQSTERRERAKQALAERLSYAASADYHPYDTETKGIKDAVAELIEKKDYAKAIAEAAKGLAKNKYDIDLLVYQAVAYREAGDTAKADKVRQRWISLVDSIMLSGDGRSFGTAFQVISVDEEYSMLRVLGLHPANQSLVHHDGSDFDVFEIRDANADEPHTVYFNVDLPLKWLNRQFSKPGK